MIKKRGNTRLWKAIFCSKWYGVAKKLILFHAMDLIWRLHCDHAHPICVHQCRYETKAFVRQKYYAIGLLKTSRFSWHRFLVAVFPTENKQFAFADCDEDFIGPSYIEEEEGNLKKHYGLIFTCLVTRAVQLETCPDLNTDTCLNTYRHFVSRRCQTVILYCDKLRPFLVIMCLKDIEKKCLKDLDKDKTHKEMAAQSTKWLFNPPYGLHFGRCFGAINSEYQAHTPDHSKVQKIHFWRVPHTHDQTRSYD